MDQIDRSIRDVSPGEGFTKIVSFNGKLPEGVHTGGCWTDGVEVWKPLDGGNAHDGPHYPTLEAECLADMEGEIGFPKNWRVEERNGRRWLVRKKALVWGQDFPQSEAEAEMGQFVETAIRALNVKGWEVGDFISLAFDTELYEWFILDLSNTHPTYTKSSMWDDEWRVEMWWKDNGWSSLARFRQKARHVVTDLGLLDRYEIPDNWRWVYASRCRPVSFTWAHKLRGKAVLVPGDYSDTKVHTWVITEGPLDDETVSAYELVLGWWPWETPGRKGEL